MFWKISYLTIILLIFTSNVNAEIFKCTDENGAVIFQDQQCTNDAEEIIINNQDKGPFGFHSSWFVSPRIGSGHASCSETGCTCKELTYEYQQDVNSRTLNALSSLPSSWNNYESQLSRYLKTKKNGHSPRNKKNLDTAGCRIAFHQKTIKLYYEEVSKNIQNEHNMASTALNGIDGQCKKPNETGWTNSNQAKKWVNCKSSNRSSHNKAVRLKKQYSSYYYSLMQEQKRLTKPRKMMK
ncbi:MAG: DUF4124 domain-containing protein [Colwellia sp.]